MPLFFTLRKQMNDMRLVQNLHQVHYSTIEVVSSLKSIAVQSFESMGNRLMVYEARKIASSLM